MKYPDLNLLVALDILLEEQSVAAAARRLNLSAPAMSRTLSRIRSTVGDPILVRAGRKLVPTARALELRALVRKTSEAAVGLLQPGSIETLATLERQFTIRANDVFVAAYGGALLAALRAKAPKVSLRLRAETDQDDEALREGRIDLWISASNALDPEVRVQTLFTTHFLGLADADHPIFDGPVTAERFAAYEHVNISRRGVNAGPIDAKLMDQGFEQDDRHGGAYVLGRDVRPAGHKADHAGSIAYGLGRGCPRIPDQAVPDTTEARSFRSSPGVAPAIGQRRRASLAEGNGDGGLQKAAPDTLA